MYYEYIFGWFNSGHKITYDLFVTLCKDDREYNILEIGCFLGRSSMYLAEKIKKSKKNIKLHCVDYFHIRDNWPKNKQQKQELLDKYGEDLLHQFNEHISKLDVKNIVIPYKMSSDEALNYFIDVNSKFDFIFIDGGHDYDIVNNDIIKSLKVLADKGIIAGDDYFTSRPNEQVQKAVHENFNDEKIKFINNESWIIEP